MNAILEADAQDSVGLYLKGRIALAENDVLQAVGLFQEAIGRDATLAGPHLYLGLIRSAQGRVDSAQDELREATRLSPDNEMAQLSANQLANQTIVSLLDKRFSQFRTAIMGR